MARPTKADKPIEKYISLPTSLVAAVELKLFSELEGRVPYGAWSKYVEQLIHDDLSKKQASKNGQGRS